jgi:lactoylglutathione lyase
LCSCCGRERHSCLDEHKRAVTMAAMSRLEPLFRKVDSLQLAVSDLDEAIAFYRDRLGHELIWRSAVAAGLRMPESDAEIVVQTERPEPEVDLLVESADEAVARFVGAGGRVVVEPFEIAIGRCVVVEDPWGNRLVLLDLSKGSLVTDSAGNVLSA